MEKRIFYPNNNGNSKMESIDSLNENVHDQLELDEDVDYVIDYLHMETYNGDYDEEDSYGTSGEKYGWYNGWSDDAIDDAFEGDPENTWNVD